MKKSLAGVVLLLLLFTANFSWAGFFDKGSFSSEGGFKGRYVPPISNIIYNETPYITTEASLWYLYQTIPDDSITSGGQINLGAAQARLALSDRLGFIATKDGYADAHFGNVLEDTDGFVNIAVGLKYAVWQNPEDDAIVTIGGRYEFPWGNLDTSGISLQGHGSGLTDLFVSAAKSFDKLGLEANLGTNIATSSKNNTSQFHYSLHADYALTEKFYPIIEINGITPIKEGNRVALNLEGHDILNLGSSGLGTTATAAAGFRYVVTKNIQFGAAWEQTITSRKDLFDERVTANVLFKF
jgi:hypothetical protein